MARIAYHPAKMSEIQDVLTKLFPTLEGGDRYLRAAQTNMVILGATAREADELDEVIAALALVHPSRFFVVIRDDAAQSIRAEVAAQCHVIGPKDYVCSEVVRLHASKQLLPLIPGIVRAQSLPGMLTELFLTEAERDPEEVGLFLPQSDRMIFDSEEFERLSDVSRLCGGGPVRLLDLQWARLSAWREQIRSVFERPLMKGMTPEIGSVEISCGRGKSGRPSTAAYLLAGWVLERLDLLPVKKIGETLHCEPRVRGQGAKAHPESLELTLKSVPGTERGRIIEVSLVAPRSDRLPGGARVVLRRGDGIIETSLELEASHRLVLPLEDERVPGLVRRTFVIGESTAKYRPSLERGLEIEAL